MESNDTHFTHSPFMYREGMYAERQAQADCSKKKLMELIARRKLTTIDRNILTALGRYGYLNAFLIRRYTAMQGLRSDPALIKERLAFLLKNGLVYRYKFFYKDPESDRVCGCPFVYSVSGGGWMFLKMTCKRQLAADGIREPYGFSALDDQNELANVLGMLAENQFAIIFLDQYGGRLDMAASMNGVCAAKCGQRLSYCVAFPDGRVLEIFPFAVRRSAGWEKRYQERLQALGSYCADSGILSYGVLVLCETSEQALACEDIRQRTQECHGLDVFYGLDHVIAASPDVLGRMLDVQCHEGGMSRSYFRLDLMSNEGSVV